MTGPGQRSWGVTQGSRSPKPGLSLSSSLLPAGDGPALATQRGLLGAASPTVLVSVPSCVQQVAS